MRAPSVDQRAQPLNPRFERKVLYNHDRTQRKLHSMGKKADRVNSLTSEAVIEVKKTLNDWNAAQSQF